MNLEPVRDIAETVAAILAAAGAVYGLFVLAVKHVISPMIETVHDRIDKHMDDEQASMHIMSTSVAYIAGSLGLDLNDAFPKEKP